jgi:hypothetical protein
MNALLAVAAFISSTTSVSAGTCARPRDTSVSECRSGRPGSAKGHLTCGGSEGGLSDSPRFTLFVPRVS